LSRRRLKDAGVKGQTRGVSYLRLLSEFRERSAQRLVEWIRDGKDKTQGARKLEARRSNMAVDARGERAARSETIARVLGRSDEGHEREPSDSTQRATRARSHTQTPQTHTVRGRDGSAISNPREMIERFGGGETESDVRAGKVRLDEAVRDVIERYVVSEERRHEQHQSGSMVRSLERIVEKLVDIELKISSPSEPVQESEKREGASLRWLDDNDLAGRLQSILRRQVRNRGIDLT
jgi:hypothetical protein